MWRVYTAILIALLGSFNFGIALVIVNTMLDNLSEDLTFEKNVGGAAVSSIFYVGAMLGGLVAGSFEKASGKFAQLWIGVLYAFGNIIAGLTADHKFCWGGPFDGCVTSMLFAARILTGFASGLMLVVSPKYLATVSPPEIRGTIGACSQLAQTIGVFFGLLLGIPYEFDESFRIGGYEWWRLMFLCVSVPPIVQCALTFLTFPLFRQSIEEVRKDFSKKISKQDIELQPATEQNEAAADSHSSANECPRETNGTLPVTTDEKPIQKPIQKPLQKRLPFVTAWTSFKRQVILVFKPKYRHCVILGIGVPTVARLCGVNILASYTTTIFENAGMDRAIIGSALYGASSIISSFISVGLFDKFQRKTMAYASFSIMAASYLGLSLSDLAGSSVAGPSSVVFAIMFTFGFRTASGILYTSYAPEVVPSEIAGIVLGFGQSLSLLVSFTLVLAFPSVLDAIGALGAFLILFCFCILSLLFLKAFMIETKGRELSDIANELVGA